MKSPKKNNQKILMVLHEVPHNSTFLLNKFRRLSSEFPIEMLVWDRKKSHKEIAGVTAAGHPKIRLGLPGLNINDILFHSLLALATGMKSPVKFFRFFSFLSAKFGWKVAVGKIIKFYPFLQSNADLVHFEFGTLGRDLIFLKDFFQFKVVVSFRGYDLNYVGLEHPGFYSPVWNNADGIHFLGQDLKSRAIKRGYQSNMNEVLISPAIDLKFFKRSMPYPQNQTVFRIVSVGRVVWKKGYEYALRAIKILTDKGLKIEYTIVGDGNFVQAIRYTIFELGITDSVRLLGSKKPEDIKAILEMSHVFLHPAVSEGYCNAVIEAQAMELPVVCSDADGLPENIDNEITGYVFPKWEVERMAEKLKKVYSDLSRAEIMGKNGRSRAENFYSLEDQIQSFKSFYLQVLNS